MAKIYDHTFSPWKGTQGTRVVAAEKTWYEPLKWDKAAAKAGERHRVFCASLADVFEDWNGRMLDSDGATLHEGKAWFTGKHWVGINDVYIGKSVISMADVRRRLFDFIDATPNLDWLLVTKRPENIAKMWPGGFRQNVWLLTSVSNQETADAMIPPLLKCRHLSPVLGLSMEPLLGPVEFSDVTNRSDAIQQLGKKALSGIDWIIAGGESGPQARPMHPHWVRDIRNQCQDAGVPFFFKQWGEWAPYYDVGAPFTEQEILGDKMAWVSPDGRWTTEQIRPSDFGDGTVIMSRVGKDAAGRLIDGRTWDEFPKVTDA